MTGAYVFILGIRESARNFLGSAVMGSIESAE